MHSTTDDSLTRGCGKRQSDATYLETLLSDSEFGISAREYMVCPPRPVDIEALGITPIGVKLIEVNGVTHVFDWVGSQHYPNVYDFIAEMQQHGVSRRISRSEDLSRLTSESRLVLIHARAQLTNATGLWDALGGVSEWVCPVHGLHGDTESREACHALYREVVEGGLPVAGPSVMAVHRTIGDTSYHANEAPIGFTPEYAPAIFATIPIGRIVVIQGDDHERSYEHASEAAIPVEVKPR